MSISSPATREPLLPWHRAAWQLLQAALRQRRLPHALLFSGIRGLGKRHLAEQFSQALLCPSPGPEGLACGECRSCHLVLAGSHPDRVVLGPDPAGKSEEIRVEVIRELIDDSLLTAHAGGYRVTLIDPADHMNLSAANSLLKTLEEPVADTLLILITAQPMRLPATLRSRCQHLLLHPPDEGSAVPWLQQQGLGVAEALLVLRLAGGAPLAGLALAQGEHLSQREDAFKGFLGARSRSADLVRIAEAWAKLDASLLLSWLASWLRDLAVLQVGDGAARLMNPDKGAQLSPLSREIHPTELQRILGLVLRLLRLKDTSANWQMALEALLIDWAVAGQH